MAKVIIVRPNITPEQEKKALKGIADVLSKMALDEYGFEVEYELEFKRNNQE